MTLMCTTQQVCSRKRGECLRSREEKMNTKGLRHTETTQSSIFKLFLNETNLMD